MSPAYRPPVGSLEWESPGDSPLAVRQEHTGRAGRRGMPWGYAILTL
jgi:hypothetical protein